MKVLFTLAGICLALAIVTPGSYAAESGQTSDELYKNDIAGPAGSEATEMQEEATFVPFVDYSGDLWTRPALTGDWAGLRTDLINRGIRIDIDLIQTYQGVLEGGTRRHWKYGGSLDIGLDLDTGKAGLWPGGLLHMRAETQFGESINRDTGALLGANIDALFPLPDVHEINLSTVVYTQFLSEWFAIFAGKIDTLDGDACHFSGARGKDQFVNMNFVLNPVALRAATYSALGFGVIFLLPNPWGPDKDKSTLSFTFLDTLGQPNVSGFSDAFDEGTVSTFEFRLPTEFFDMPGSQLVGMSYSSRDFTVLDQDPRLILGGLLGLGPFTLATEDDSWSFNYNFHQYLFVKKDQKRESSGALPATKLLQGLGVFGRFGYADPDTSPIEAFYSIGVGGRGLIPGRENDTFGAGFFYVDISDELPNLVLRRFGDSNGVEVFYNIEIAPWFHVTPDIQIINPSNKRVDTAIVFGIRTRIDF